MRKASVPILLAIALGIASAFAADAPSPWRFEGGVSVGNPTPLALVAGFGYKNVIFRAEGLGAHNGPNDFWCGYRGSLAWTFFRNLPFKLDVGVGGSYEFAEAPNKLHQAFNDANGEMYLYPYNYTETLDISAEIWAHLYGFFTQVAYPIHYFKKHDEPEYIIWRVGYMIEI